MQLSFPSTTNIPHQQHVLKLPYCVTHKVLQPQGITNKIILLSALIFALYLADRNWNTVSVILHIRIYFFICALSMTEM